MNGSDCMEIDRPPPSLSFNEKWEHFKRVLEDLYLDQKMGLPKIQEVMRDRHGFDADSTDPVDRTHQYKYRFNKWGWKKNIPTTKKKAILEFSQSSAQSGNLRAVKYKGRPVEPKKLRRYVRSFQKEENVGLFAAAPMTGDWSAFLAGQVVGGRVGFLNWNVPYKALVSLFPTQMAQHSPFAANVSTPSDVSMASPAGIGPASPGYYQALVSKTKAERAHLFIAGRFDELLRALDAKEKRPEQGPLLPSNAPSPSFEAERSSGSRTAASEVLPNPPSLCRWTIHVYQEGYDRLPSSLASAVSDHDENLDREWPEDWEQPSFDQKLQDNLQNNDFSTVGTERVPISVNKLVETVQKSPGVILQEAITFAIVGRNYDLLDSLLKRAADSRVSTDNIYPLHLAATYLDGSRTCCHIMDLLAFSGPNRMVINASGYTVLDTLFLAILRNHSTIIPEQIDEALRTSRQFPGGEIDICGRWDADSKCYHALVTRGSGIIPENWKHKFCHTSIQAICHCIKMVKSRMGIRLDQPSGLFVKRCFQCGRKLEVSPLHALVLIAFHLATSGLENEDLFGILCCLFSLTEQTDKGKHHYFYRVDVSVELLRTGNQGDFCTHESLSPAELAESLTQFVLRSCSDDIKVGWELFCCIIYQIEQVYLLEQRTGSPKEDNENIETENDDERALGDQFSTDNVASFRKSCHDHLVDGLPTSFGSNRTLGHICAAAQAELLTYRRIDENGYWTSSNFDMRRILHALETGTGFAIPLLGKGILHPYCACGVFYNSWDFDVPTRRDDACETYFSNMEDWNRTVFLDDSSLPL
ncbi:hypothetical protein NA57DRAFT_53297 [Rhizodiscina lignyota]|uniref:Clr5 domain-containing protein n=1 Tax=Rhizodiscina lignyota TaxID=1504668 RepID=A0A9P4M844_9PEZI|nr:hypothetical protein NA57DRAFT_53297 [Rhizodiscina lignyota]